MDFPLFKILSSLDMVMYLENYINSFWMMGGIIIGILCLQKNQTHLGNKTFIISKMFGTPLIPTAHRDLT